MTAEERFMKEAIRQAKKALALEEVPIGCVIVHEGKIIARGYNRRNTDKNTLSHAELNAMRKASKKLGDWRLEGCTMYVTLEPCQMCAGALVQSRIDEVVIGSMNPKAGCAGSVLNLLEEEKFNHQVKVTRGILEEECSEMLSSFFLEVREKKKYKKMLLKAQAEALKPKTVIKGVVFDVDGTLLDSMPIWMEAGIRYLHSLGLEPEKDLGQKLFAMTMEETAVYLKNTYKIEKEIPEIIEDINIIVGEFYFQEAPLKPGALELLTWMKEQGMEITVATATDRWLIEGAFERLGLMPFFKKIFTCTEVGAGKNKPLVYQEAARCMGTKPEETCVVEDAFHGIRTAKKAGFFTAGVYDEASRGQQREIKNLASVYGKSLEKVREKLQNIM